MKKFICCLLSVIMIIVSLPVSAFAVDISKYIAVKDKYELADIANNPGGNYYLTDDILFTANDFKYNGDFFNNGDYFDSISNFNGRLDGCGHTISGLKADSLIGTNNGTVENICLKNCTFTSAAVCEINRGDINNCKLESSTASSIVKDNNGNISYCFSNDNDCGICDANSGYISYCINNSDLYSGGGIANTNYNSIAYCINNGNIQSDDGVSGGICAGNSSADYGASNPEIYSCINNGSIKGYKTGGICSYSWYGTIVNCLNTGNVNASAKLSQNIRGPKNWSAGIAELQYDASLICCVNTGSIDNGTGAATALIRDYQKGKTQSCYYLANTGRLNLDNGSDNGTSSLTSSAIAKERSYPDFDFDNEWQIKDGELSLQMVNTRQIGASIYTLPSKIYYDIGDSFEPEGLNIISYDNNGIWTFTDTYEYSGFTGNFGINKIHVSTGGFDNQFEVIVQDKIENCIIEPFSNPFVVTGKCIEPIPQIISDRGDVLEYGTDFTLKYENNVDIGIAKILVQGIGLYKGTAELSFLIVPQERLEIVEKPEKYYYSFGEELDTAGLIVKEFMDDGLWHIVDDYEISGYTGNLGKNTIKISKDGFETGFDVFVQEFIGNMNIRVTKATAVATGSQIKVPVVITTKGNAYLENNKDYKLTYSNNVNPGKATITIKGINKYKGTAVRTFIITPMKTTGLKLSSRTDQSLKISWAKQAGVDGYKVEKYNAKTKKYELYKTLQSNTLTVPKLSSATSYSFRVRSYKTVGKKAYYGAYSSVLKAKTNSAKVNKASISSVTPKTNAFTVKWKKVSDVNGYQIQYSANSNFKSAKTVTVANNKTTSKSVSKLKGKTKYYVRIRAYKTINAKKYYSSWSASKSVKTKAKKTF